MNTSIGSYSQLSGPGINESLIALSFAIAMRGVGCAKPTSGVEGGLGGIPSSRKHAGD